MKHRTREGIVMDIKEMEDAHLQNTIALKQRQLQPYLDEAKRRRISPTPTLKTKLRNWYRRQQMKLQAYLDTPDYYDFDEYEWMKDQDEGDR